LAVQDLHPDYMSTRFAKDLCVNTMSVQHHFAHIASVMAEQKLNEKIIGIAFDGTGLGTDGNIWGSEFLICTPTEFERFSHFEYIPLPGGDKAVLEPWRSAVAYLNHYFGKEFLQFDIPFTNKLDINKTNLLLNAIEKKLNTPLSCSCGRLFDAVSALTEICSSPKFYAEAPMRLEAAIKEQSDDLYSYDIFSDYISLKKMWIEIISDIKKDITYSLISVKFHNTIVDIIVYASLQIRAKTGLNKIALSGGSFQNKYLLERAEILLIKNNFEVFSNQNFPSNDGGIALGQIYIAANITTDIKNQESRIKTNQN